MNKNGRKQAIWPRTQSTGSQARKRNRTGENAEELRIPKNTLYGWVRASRLGNLDLGTGSQTPQSAMTFNEERVWLRQQIREQEKEIRCFWLFWLPCGRTGYGYEHESPTMCTDTGKCRQSPSGHPGSGHSQWQREPVYQPDIPGYGLPIWHKTKHEQRRRKMPCLL